MYNKCIITLSTITYIRTDCFSILRVSWIGSTNICPSNKSLHSLSEGETIGDPLVIHYITYWIALSIVTRAQQCGVKDTNRVQLITIRVRFRADFFSTRCRHDPSVSVLKIDVPLPRKNAREKIVRLDFEIDFQFRDQAPYMRRFLIHDAI